VVSSGFAAREELQAMLTHGLRGFIPKPFAKHKLLQHVRAVLDLVQSESAK
jgi:DNA-binding NarL/FixJ family response regulator